MRWLLVSPLSRGAAESRELYVAMWPEGEIRAALCHTGTHIWWITTLYFKGVIKGVVLAESSSVFQLDTISREVRSESLRIVSSHWDAGVTLGLKKIVQFWSHLSLSAHVVNNRLSVSTLKQLLIISQNSFLLTPSFVKSIFFGIVKLIHTHVDTNG